MKNIEGAIGKMNKRDAKALKYVGELALNCSKQVAEGDREQEEAVDEIIEMLITTSKDRVKELASAELAHIN